MSTIRGKSLGIVFVLIIPLAYAALYQIRSNDIFWHLKMGLDLLSQGLSPFVDHYSIEFQGQPISNVPWFFQVLTASFYSLFGGNLGLQILRLLFWLIPFAMFAYWLNRNRIHWLYQIPLLLAMVAGLSYRRLLRPEMGSYAFLLGYVLLFLKNRHQISFKVLFTFMALQFLWNNYHASSVFGYVVLAGLYLDYSIISIRQRDWSQLSQVIGIGSLTLLSGFFTPYWKHPLLLVTRIEGKSFAAIQEYQHMLYWDQPLFFQLFWILVGLVIAHQFYRHHYGSGLMLSVFTYQFWFMTKHFPQLILVFLPFIAVCSKPFLEKVSIRHPVRLSLLVLFTVVSGYHVFTRTFLIGNAQPKQSLNPVEFPLELENRLNQIPHKGKTLNSHGIGGYLLFKHASNLSVFIDGRTNILYPLDYLSTYQSSTQRLSQFLSLDDKLRFDYVVGEHTWADDLVDTAVASGRFKIDYLGQHFALLKKSQGNKRDRFTHLFVFPQCLEDNDQDLLEGKSDFYSNTLTQYFDAPNKHEFLNHLASQPNLPPPVLRLGAHLALKHQQNKLALFFFSKVGRSLKRHDLFAIVDTLCRVDQCKGAKFFLKKNTKTNLPPWAKVKLRQQLDQIEKSLGSIDLGPGNYEKFLARTTVADGDGPEPNLENPCRLL